MKVLKASLVLFALAICVYSCSKSNDVSTPVTNAGLVNNWGVKNTELKGYFDNILFVDSTAPGYTGDYVDFTADGLLYSQIFGEKDTSTYTQLSSSKVAFTYLGETDTFAISNLTSTTVSLSYTTPAFDTILLGQPGTAYAIESINLTR